MKISTVIKSVAFASTLALSAWSNAADVGVNVSDNDLAIQGYDTVAYFTDGKPTKGSSKYTSTYQGAIYHFSTESNRDNFKADPTKFAPQYGGFCAMGVALSKKLDTDPNAWRIVNNKLYLNLNKAVQKKWVTDIPGYIESSERNWNGIESVSAEVLDDE